MAYHRGTLARRRVAFLRCRQKIHTIRQRGVVNSLRLAIEGTLHSESRPLNGALELHST